MQQLPWVERKFNFDFPSTMFPVIIARLRGASPRIHDVVNGLSQSELIYQPGGKWSIQQHIGHLSDLEELHAGRIVDFANHAKQLRAWDGLNKKTEEANHNARNINDVLIEFNSVRTGFIRDLLQFDERDFSFMSMHPRLGVPMRIVDMAYFVAEHDDHHIAKMWQVRNEFVRSN